MKITVTQHGEHSTSFKQFRAPDGCDRVEFFKDQEFLSLAGVKLKEESVLNLARQGFLRDTAFILYHMADGSNKLDVISYEGFESPPYITVN